MAIYTIAQSLVVFLPLGKPVYLIEELAPTVYKENKDFTVIYCKHWSDPKQFGRSDTWICQTI